VGYQQQCIMDKQQPLRRLATIAPLHLPEGKGGTGCHDAHDKGVDIGDEDDGALVGEGALPADGGEGSPLLEVEGELSIGDEVMALGVGGGTDNNPPKHSVTAVPPLSLGGRSPPELGELRVFLLPVLHSGGEDSIRDLSGLQLGVGAKGAVEGREGVR
jgi:hypothetical protein